MPSVDRVGRRLPQVVYTPAGESSLRVGSAVHLTHAATHSFNKFRQLFSE
jgi:hypothetical protein